MVEDWKPQWDSNFIAWLECQTEAIETFQGLGAQAEIVSKHATKNYTKLPKEYIESNLLISCMLAISNFARVAELMILQEFLGNLETNGWK